MTDLRVPKSMPPDVVAWAFRHGVVGGMRMRGRVLSRQPGGFSIAPRNVHALADRVRIEWMRRHLATERPRNVSSALDSPHGGSVVAQILAEGAFQWVSENDLQVALKNYLDAQSVLPEREVRLSDGVSRIDLLARGVGIEVKIDGSWASVVRQLTRYAKCPEIVSLVLVTTRAKHHNVPSQLCGKPLSLVSLVGIAL